MPRGINFVQHGNFSKLEAFLTKGLHFKPAWRAILNKYGQKGVEALQEATPKDTGKTADSWSYEVIEGEHGFRLVWKNSNIQNGILIALLLQYGHATGNGGYVEGIDYINPAIRSIFKGMADEAWKEITGLKRG